MHQYCGRDACCGRSITNASWVYCAYYIVKQPDLCICKLSAQLGCFIVDVGLYRLFLLQIRAPQTRVLQKRCRIINPIRLQRFCDVDHEGRRWLPLPSDFSLRQNNIACDTPKTVGNVPKNCIQPTHWECCSTWPEVENAHGGFQTRTNSDTQISQLV